MPICQKDGNLHAFLQHVSDAICNQHPPYVCLSTWLKPDVGPKSSVPSRTGCPLQYGGNVISTYNLFHVLEHPLHGRLGRIAVIFERFHGQASWVEELAKFLGLASCPGVISSLECSFYLGNHDFGLFFDVLRQVCCHSHEVPGRGYSRSRL